MLHYTLISKKIKHNAKNLRIFWGKGVMRLGNMLVFPVGTTQACHYASIFLKKQRIPLTDHPSPEVTHLMLDVPSFDSNGTLRSGGAIDAILERLPGTITVVGGNILHPALAGYQTLDLLTDPHYLAANAAITADCALQVAAPKLSSTLYESPTLILGWGRIGKCLGFLMKRIGTKVTIAARKETDRAMIRALGFEAVEISEIPRVLSNCKLLFNTVPEMILPQEKLVLWKSCVKIDLASKSGIGGDDVIWARGLPGIYAPESSGRLIAETFLKMNKEVSA